MADGSDPTMAWRVDRLERDVSSLRQEFVSEKIVTREFEAVRRDINDLAESIKYTRRTILGFFGAFVVTFTAALAIFAIGVG